MAPTTCNRKKKLRRWFFHPGALRRSSQYDSCPLSSDSDIFVDDLGFSEITLASPRLPRLNYQGTWHLG
ncbi:hypothetical protein CsSME_00006600 [Camellia sinensis var. sinensis]